MAAQLTAEYAGPRHDGYSGGVRTDRLIFTELRLDLAGFAGSFANQLADRFADFGFKGAFEFLSISELEIEIA